VSPSQVAAAVVALGLAGFAVWRRRRLGGERVVLALLGAVVLGVYASGVLSELPDAKQVIEDIASALGEWTYVLVGLLAFLETGAFVGLVAPGETVVIAGGVIAGQGTIDLLPLIGLTWACCIAGDSTSFFIGRRLGRQFLERHGPKVKITPERLERVDGYFREHGGKTILIGRFIGLVRALAPFVAGSSGMPYGRFIPYSIIGTGLWSTFFLLLGYSFWRSFDRVADIAGRATFAFGVVVGTIVLIVWSYRRLRDPEQRERFLAWVERQSRRPLARPFAAVAIWLWRTLLRPVWRVVWPQVRFVWQRITPGDLGLELTTALAVTGVGFYVFVAYLVILSGDPAPTGFDLRVQDMTSDLRTDLLVDVAEIVTVFGSLPVVSAFVGVGALVLLWRRRPIELAVLILSMVLIYAAVHITKGFVERARPPEPIGASEGFAYPSGHAAYATAYVALAVIAARVLPGIFSRAIFVVLAVATAAAIGASRVALEVHWASDVLGGWALGAAIFGAVGVVGLIVGYLRNNGPPTAAPSGRREPAAREPV
jgi:membrane protein DedA with SNARE-associated domain